MLNTNFEFWDYLIFGIYALVIIAVGLWVSRGKKGVQKTTEDYFLASKSLPWWAIGASLIAANISAESIYRDVRFGLCSRVGYRFLRVYGSVDLDYRG